MRFICILLILAPLLSASQTLTGKSDIHKRSEIAQILELGENGYVVQTKRSSELAKTKDVVITRVDAFGKVVYNTRLTDPGFLSNDEPMFSSPAGELVAHLNIGIEKPKAPKPMVAVHFIDEKGKVTEQIYQGLPGLDDQGDHREGWIGNDRLYILYSEQECQGKYSEDDCSAYLLMIDKDFSHKSVKLDLSNIDRDEISSFWRYSGQTENGFYIHRKRRDNSRFFRIEVNEIDWEGQVLQTFEIMHDDMHPKVEASNCKMKIPGWFRLIKPQPAISPKKFPIPVQPRDFRRRFNYDFTPQGSKRSEVFYDAMPGAFGGFHYEPALNGFLFFGLKSQKTGDKKEKDYHQFVTIFDLDGQLRWEAVLPFSYEHLGMIKKNSHKPYEIFQKVNLKSNHIVLQTRRYDNTILTSWDLGGKLIRTEIYEIETTERYYVDDFEGNFNRGAFQSKTQLRTASTEDIKPCNSPNGIVVFGKRMGASKMEIYLIEN